MIIYREPLGEGELKDKWHKSVMYGLIKDEFAALGKVTARRDNLFVNEVFPTHAIS